jgi:hypothetical protein
MRITALVAVAALTLATTGCHLVFPFGTTSDSAVPDAGADEAGAPDARSPDLATTDTSQPDQPLPDQPQPDQPLPDQPLPDQPLPDQPWPDQPWPDQPWPDACVPGVGIPASTPCVDNEGRLTNGCGGACAPLDDLDCDGLRAGAVYVQDPWPLTRNLLLIADGFTAPLGARWKATVGVSQNTSAGEVTIPDTESLDLAVSCTGVLTGTNDLLESRFTVKAIHKPSSWFISFYSALNGPQHRRCSLIKEATSASPGLEIIVRDAALNQTPGFATPVSAAAGSSFIMQSWGTTTTGAHSHHCRLLTADGKQVLQQVSASRTITLAGGLKVSAANSDAVVDYVRIYKR